MKKGNLKNKTIKSVSILVMILTIMLLNINNIDIVNADITNVGDSQSFDYTGDVQEFIVPKTGIYKLETWGAQGGSGSSTFYGGYGAYSTGLVFLEKGETVYVNVGGQGSQKSGSNGGAGGYNGGGAGGNGTSGYSGGNGGGGATHIATKSGLLQSLENNKKSILIVSGGGGGYSGHDSTANYVGSGGGKSGTNSSMANGADQSSGYAFGLGQNGRSSSGLVDRGAEGNGGGGGGYYGGRSTTATGAVTNSSGSGGSGYIGNELLTDKKMVMYSDDETYISEDEETKTEITQNVSETPTADYAKSGNGAAKITYIENNNNYLSNLEVEENTLEYTFDKHTTTYNAYILKNETSIHINAQADDELAAVAGDGEIDVSSKPSSVNITVTAENGEIRVYTINIYYVEENQPNIFNYTGDIQEFIVPKTGLYKLETWGAQGGGSDTDKNYGGYSTGLIELEKNQKLYIVVGGIPNGYTGGYNGGGSAGSAGSAGGGATHISTSTGLLRTLSNDKDSVLIVSGGGGGSDGGSGGGSGGGLKGARGGDYGSQYPGGSGGTQTGAGTGGGFGYGGSAASEDGDYGSAGGGGYYGGGRSAVRAGSGGGGSGYIGNELLTDKKMVMYSTDSSFISNEESTKTEITENVSETSTADYAKIGNGAAKITYVKNNNNYLSNLEVEGYSLDNTFNKKLTTYNIYISEKETSIHVNAQADDELATVAGDGEIDISSKPSSVNITVTAEYGDIRVYTINIHYVAKNQSNVFNYTGNEQVFIAPKTGKYKLETWGAQGGNSSYNSYEATGGYGGYSEGIIELEKGDVLYINVGGKGQSVYYNTSSTPTTDDGIGYNGGGYGSYYSNNSSHGAGGGATHIATSSGLLSTFKDNTSNVLMVAGGGGGASTHTSYPSYSGTGGSGGGIKGSSGITANSTCYNYGTGGSQTSIGSYTTCSSDGRGNESPIPPTAAFGKGQSYSSFSTTGVYSGGGAGYYGGGSGFHGPGAGGSGYIGNELLTDKKMVMYSANSSYISNEESTKTEITEEVSETPTADYAKSGNGAAKITYLGLKLINDITVENETITPSFNIETPLYKVIVDKNTENVKINVDTTDLVASITGDGFHQLSSGENLFDIIVTDVDGEVVTYQVEVLKEVEIPTSTDCNDVTYNEQEQTLIDSDSAYNFSTNDKDLNANLETNAGTYDMTVSLYPGYVWSDGTKENKTVTCSMKKKNPVITVDKTSITVMNRKSDTFNEQADVPGSFKVTSPVAHATQDNNGEVQANTNNKVTVTGAKDGSGILTITFTPTDTTNYNVVEKNITIVVQNNPDVVEDVIEPTDYDPYNYGCTNSIQEFVAPIKGKYKLEVWGAQGGSYTTQFFTSGGYSTGEIQLEKDEKIYVVVGCQGSQPYGGYNGGGNGTISTRSNEPGYGGGGATHISKTETLLKDTPINDLLIAAGGGGGFVTDGSGGGYIGNNGNPTISSSTTSTHKYENTQGFGGTQTSGGACGHYGSGSPDCSVPAGYGYGANAAISINKYEIGGSGGGGGYYGGGASGGYYASSGSSGGGGSGYIGNSALTNKHMTCYRCATSSAEDTKTISVTNRSSSATADYAKQGNGAARITVLEDYSEPKLKSLTVTGEYTDETLISEPGDETLFNVNVNKYELGVTVTPEAVSKGTSITYQKNVKIATGETSTFISVTNQAGEVNIYRINFYREPNDITYLTDLTIDGTTIPGFDKDTLEYTINKDSFDETKSFEIGAKLYSDEQVVTGLGTYNYENGSTDYEVTVTSEDGNHSRTYIIHMVKPHTTRLKELELDGYSLSPSFDKDTLEYTVSIGKMDTSVGINKMIPFDDSVSIQSTGHKFIRLDQNGVIKITVTHPEAETTTYTINANRDGLVDNGKWGFGCKGSSETWTAPETRYYVLETWGAQGGKNGGRGGYSSSKVKLTEGQELYVTVGCQGGLGITTGYNGGGAGTNSQNWGGGPGGAGGGATHIAINSNLGELKNYEKNKSDVLIVAGGGGGSAYDGNNSGAGGGYNGVAGGNDYSGSGGGQASGGTGNGWVLTGFSGYFGRGGSASTNSIFFGFFPIPLPRWSAGGGGGGYYGGGGGDTALFGNAGGGGGGSGFINTNSGIKTKNPVSINGDSQMPTYKGGYSTGKTGDGFATIMQAEYPSDNNNLMRLDILAIDETSLDETKKDYTPELSSDVTDYYVHLESNETKVIIDADVEDGDAEILSGPGTYFVDGTEKNVTIDVKADNGDVKTYTIHFTRDLDTNSKPLDIKIEGLIPNYCSESDIYCKLNPESFDPETDSYEMLVPGKIDTLKFVVEKAHKNQTVTGDGSVYLSKDENYINISVTSEDGSSTTVYKYKIERDLDSSPYLDIIKVLDPDIDINYSKKVFDYYITVPTEYDRYVDNHVDEKDASLENTLQFYIKPESEHTSYTISGNGNLKYGSNKLEVIATARNGDVAVYNITVYRSKDISTLLSDLKVYNGSEEVELIPEYNKLKYSYRGEVDNTVTSVNIVATPEDSRSTVSGDGVQELTAGKNSFPVIITTPAGDTETYVINITRKKENNNYLSSLVVKNGEEELTYEPEFNKETYEYNLTVDNDVNKLDIIGTPESEKAKVLNLYDTIIKVGNNKKSIYVYAEDGSSKVYTVNIKKSNGLENKLTDIKVYDKDDNELTYEPVFDKDTHEYRLEVENDIDMVTVIGTKENPDASLTGNGKYSLAVGQNVVHLVLIVSGKEPVSYSILITRKPSANAYLKDIKLSEGSLTPTFNKETLEYTVNVNNDIENIEITGEPELISTTVTGNGKKELQTGDNNFELVTMAEDGETSLTYKIKVVKEESDNNNIKSLILEEGGLTPEFKPSITEYSASVPYEVTSGTFRVELEDPKATYEIIGNENFKEGENEVTIRVTSESGKTKDYVVNINRQQESTLNYLASLTVSEGTLTPAFDKHIQFYEVEVESNIETDIIDATAEYTTSTVEGTGLKVLSKGKNLYLIRVTDKNGIIRDYQILITRKGNNEARLKNLELNQDILSPAFDKDTYAYSTSTASESLDFAKIEPLDSNATYEVKNNSFTEEGEYTVTIEVTAEDGVTKKEYNITVTKNLNDNNNLAYLGVEGFNIIPKFDKTTVMYSLTVPYDTNVVNVIAKAEDKNATITGDGINNLVPGTNNIFVTVTSQSGKAKTYTITINKQKSSSNELELLDVRNGTISPTYSNDIYEYDVEIPYEENMADIYYVLKDESAKVSIIGNEDLKVGLNEVTMTVTSEDGDVRIINLHVTKKNPVSSLLKTLKVNGYEINPEFNSYLMNYELDVNNETEKLDMVIETLDPDATYVVRGNNLEVGSNEVTIEVTASDNVTKSTYTINVNRDEYVNNYLLYLYTNRGDLTPEFNARTNEYSITVENKIEDIDIIAKAENTTATVSSPNTNKIETTPYDGLVGRFSLEPGENKIYVEVTTEDAHTRKYIINVNREKNDDNYLASLKVYHNGVAYELTPNFDKSTTSYSLNVDPNVEDVVLVGTPHDERATVDGLGEKQVKFGDNTFDVVVTAEDGSTRTYTIVINRALSTINNLFLLEPSSGELEPEFDGDTLEYDLVLDESVSTLWFDYIAEDKYSTVEGVEEKIVPDGTSVREIVVTAENGDTKTYTVNVIKQRKDNAYLSNLYVVDYPFVNTEGEEVTFDKEVYDYYIKVPYEKAALNPSEVVYETEDENATVTKDSTINLYTTKDNIYKVKVTAKDGFTTHIYNIHVERAKNDNALLSTFEAKVGKLDKEFIPTTFDYVWTLDENKEITPLDVIYTLMDENATATPTESVTYVEGEDNAFEIVVTSENGKETNTYRFVLEMNTNEKPYLKSLTASVGTLEPEFNKEINTYDLYEYDDVESVTLSAEPEDPTSTVTGTGIVNLTSEFVRKEITVTGTNGETNVYVVNIHKVVPRDDHLEDLGLNGLDGLNCVNNMCTLNPEFNPEETTYSIKVPYEYDKLDVYYRLNNEHQTVEITVDGNEYVKGMDLKIGETEVAVKVYNGLKELTNTYTMTVIRLENVTITTPDGPIVYPKGEDYELPTNDKEKASENAAEVTFKLHNGEEDIVRYVTKNFTPNGWLINDVHYDDKAVVKATEDLTLVPDYIETISGVEFPSNPTKENYEFTGWYTEETDGIKIENYSLEEDITLHAQYKKETITITTPDGPIEVPKGEEYELPTNDKNKADDDIATVTFKPHNGEEDTISYVKKHYEVNGWLIDGVHYDDKAIIIPTEDITLVPDYIETIIGAEFPSDPEKDNYIFNGWYDSEEGGTKYESYNKEEDITLHAHYEELVLPEDIELDAEDITIVVGETHQIEVTFIPEGSRDILTYTNYDENIISVTNDGIISGLEVGTTTITVGTKHTDIEKTINVTVIGDKLASDIYEVRDSEYEGTDYRIVIGAEIEATISEFKDNMTNPNEYIKIYDTEGNELAEDDIIKTRLVIKLEYNGMVLDEAYVVLRGDVDGDGYVNVSDYITVLNVTLENDFFDDYIQFAAADVEEDEIINVSDYIKIMDYNLENIDSLND